MNSKEVKALAKKTLSEKRYKHTCNVKKMAVKLAKRWGADEEQAALAAYLHDIAKELPKDEMLRIMQENAIMANGAEKRPVPVWHGVCAAILGKTQYGITDQAVLDAVACHTTGRPGMTLLDKILFMADMTSEERDFPGVDKLRKLEMKDLETAMLEALRQTVAFVIESEKPLDEVSQAAYEDMLKNSPAAKGAKQ